MPVEGKWISYPHPNIRDSDPTIRNPRLYSAPEIYAAEVEVSEFLAALVRILKPDHVLETGAHLGHSTLAIANALHSNGVGYIHTVESDIEKARLLNAKTGILPILVYNSRFQEMTPPEGVTFDLAFFDATLEKKDEEFMHFWRMKRLLRGAFVAFHDTGFGRGRDMSVPKRAEVCVQKLIARGYIKTLFIPCPRGLTIGKVLV